VTDQIAKQRVTELSNHMESPASNRAQAWKATTPSFAGSRNRGEIIMNPIQKAATAFMALTITCVGSTLVTAPLAFADMRPAAANHATVCVVQSTTAPGTASSRQG
jgi:hypothetical protein